MHAIAVVRLLELSQIDCTLNHFEDRIDQQAPQSDTCSSHLFVLETKNGNGLVFYLFFQHRPSMRCFYQTENR